MMHTNRSTDRESTPYTRRERLHLKAGLWYFHTREGEPIGPFRYRGEAEAMLARFIDKARQDQQQMEARTLKRKPHFRTAAVI